MKMPIWKKPHSSKIPHGVSWPTRGNVQNSIPYEAMSPDGIAALGGGRYSMAFSFTDINYNSTSEQNQLTLFEKYCKYLNSYDETVGIQLYLENVQLARVANDPYLKEPPGCSSELAQCIRDYNEQMETRITGAHSYIQQKYVILTVQETDLESARRRFDRLDTETLAGLRSLHCRTHRLSRLERYVLLRNIYRPDDTAPVTQTNIQKTGIYEKDLIAPYSMEVTDHWVKLGDYYTRTYFLTDFPDELSDDILQKILDADEDLYISVHITPQNPQGAIQETKKKLRGLDRNKYAHIMRMLRQNIPIPEIPRDLQLAIDDTEDFLEDLQTRNEKMFMVAILILVRAKSLPELDEIANDVKGRIAQTGCQMQLFSFSHEDAFNSILPLGRNDSFIKRTFTTTSTAVFLPFNVVEIVHQGGFSYGKNQLSNNLLLMDRNKLTNPHGFYFGVSGSGKSMGAKNEIWECAMRTNDDMLIIDADGEFSKITNALGGQVIDISASSNAHINPLDISEEYGGEDETGPIKFKSDFIISLIEVTLNYRNGIDHNTRSIIDRAVRRIYEPWLKAQRNKKCCPEIPTLVDFLNVLRTYPEPEAQYLATGLEIYVEGSLNLFAEHTNVQLDNRLVCFVTKRLGKQLRTPAMSIIQDYCWNRITQNQQINKCTRLWNDEVHLSLQNPCSAEWLIESWKRGRKYGLIATGMTQEVKDACVTEAARGLIANSEFIMLYRQKEDTLMELSRVVQLTPPQQEYLLSCEPGTGIFKAGNDLVEFTNRFAEGTKLYSLMETSIGKKQEEGMPLA